MKFRNCNKLAKSRIGVSFFTENQNLKKVFTLFGVKNVIYQLFDIYCHANITPTETLKYLFWRSLKDEFEIFVTKIKVPNTGL